MLYHWYELDLEAATPIDSDSHVRTASHIPAVRYDKTAAIACARGGTVRLTGEANIPTASNDTEPDVIATRLYAAGLGMLGDPTHRAQPKDYTVLHRTIAFARTMAMQMCRCASGLVNFAHRSSGQMAASCSHMIVSVDHDDNVRARNGARRQRLEASGRQTAN